MPDLHVIERRIFRTEFREVPGSNGRQRWARAVTYGTVDDYGTWWMPRCFEAALDARMPTMLYGHDWYSLEHVLGQGIDHREQLTADEFGPPGCDVLLEFADPEQVPSSRLAMVLTSRSTDGRAAVLKDVSVGFDRQEWIRKDDLTPEQLSAGAEEAMVRAAMDELSIVVRGAVPGASMRGRRSWVIDGNVSTEPPDNGTEPVRAQPVEVRMGSKTVDIESVVKVAKAQAAGDLTPGEARAALEALASEPADSRVVGGVDPDEDVNALASAVDAALDAALACAADVDVTGWPTECQQMWGCVVAAETACDELLEALGVADPDDMDTPDVPAVGTMGTASAVEAETRELSDVFIEAVVARAAKHVGAR